MLIVMGHGTAAAFLHREARLRPIQRLNLAFLIYAHDHGLVGRVKIDSHHSSELLYKTLVLRQLEGLNSVRLQSVSLPDPLHGRLAYPLTMCHRAR
jgi:hypothetical protein